MTYLFKHKFKIIQYLNTKMIAKDTVNWHAKIMNERLSLSHLDFDPMQDVTARNRELEHLLNPENRFPHADVYPILGSTFSADDLARKIPEGTLLPAEQALATKENVSLILGADEKIAAGMILTANNGLHDALTIIDTFASEQFRGKGFGKKLYLELLKALPPGVEATSHAILLDDGQKMWDWLMANGLAKERADYDPNDEVAGQYVTQVNEFHSAVAAQS